jgi:hypothetical protein
MDQVKHATPAEFAHDVAGKIKQYSELVDGI